MVSLRFRYLGLAAVSVIPLTLALAIANPASAQNAASTDNIENTPTEDLTDPNNLRPLNQADSLLSLEGGQKLMKEAETAIDAEDYDLAAQKLQDARQVFNQLSNFHLQLATSFQGIENEVFDSQRQQALESGQMRDEATYKLALVHRAKNQPELAVPLLIQVIKSQNPTSDLGKKSYQQLFELGFVNVSYPPAQQ